MFPAQTRRRIYTKVVVPLVIAILSGVIAPPGSASAEAMAAYNPEAVEYRYANGPTSALTGALDPTSLAEDMNLPPEVAQMMPSLDANGEPVGFLMNAEALQQQTQFEPAALAEPISLSRVQSTYVAGGGVTGTVVLTFTVTNNQAPSIAPNIPVSATITETLKAAAAIDYSRDPNVIHNVLLANELLPANAALISANPTPDRSGDSLAWNLGDVLPLGSVAVTLTVEVSVSALDFTALDAGATAWGTLQGRPVSASTTPATLAPESFSQWLIWTVDADYYDEYAVQKAAELGNDPQTIFEYVRSLGYESYKGSLRGTRGTLWSEAGNSVDQASLLVAMLRGSGVPARYRHGTLITPTAQSLILSMFPELEGVIGHIPDGTEVADPANDPQLLEETVDHWWVEAFVGGMWVDLDPCFADATTDQTFYDELATDGTDIIAELPDDLRHKVSITLKVEHAESIASLIPNNLPVSYPLSHTFTTVELVGNPVTLGHLVNSDPTGGLVFGVVEHTYLPYFAVGDFDVMIEGAPFQELVSNFPFGYRIVTAEWLLFETRDPDGATETYTREVFDNIGRPARRLGGQVTLPADQGTQPQITDFDLFTVMVASSRTSSTVIQKQMTKLSAAARDVTAADVYFESESPEQVALDDGTNIAAAYHQARLGVLASNATLLFTFLTVDDALARSMGDLMLVRGYSDRPRLIVVHSGMVQNQAGDFVSQIGMDLVHPRRRAFPWPGQAREAGSSFRFLLGLGESTLEKDIVEQATGQEPITALSIFDKAEEQGIELEPLSEENMSTLTKLDISDAAKAFILDDIEQGYVIVVPRSRVSIGDGEMTGWWRIDPRTGETIGMLEDGSHGMIEFIAQIKTSHVMAVLVGGFATGVIVAGIEIITLVNGTFVQTLFSGFMGEIMENVFGEVLETVIQTLTKIKYIVGIASAVTFIPTYCLIKGIAAHAWETELVGLCEIRGVAAGFRVAYPLYQFNREEPHHFAGYCLCRAGSRQLKLRATGTNQRGKPSLRPKMVIKTTSERRKSAW